jgi:hypothetical protein
MQSSQICAAFVKYRHKTMHSSKFLEQLEQQSLARSGCYRCCRTGLPTVIQSISHSSHGADICLRLLFCRVVALMAKASAGLSCAYSDPRSRHPRHLLRAQHANKFEWDMFYPSWERKTFKKFASGS